MTVHTSELKVREGVAAAVFEWHRSGIGSRRRVRVVETAVGERLSPNPFGEGAGFGHAPRFITQRSAGAVLRRALRRGALKNRVFLYLVTQPDRIWRHITLRLKEIVMRLVVAAVSVVALALAAPAAADPPTGFTSVDVFPDVNPCTGNVNIVTISSSGFIHEHGSREVLYGERTITTSDGFAGHGTDTFVFNGQIILFRQTDILTNASGDRIRAHGEFVLDISTDTLRVEKFELTCLGK